MNHGQQTLETQRIPRGGPLAGGPIFISMEETLKALSCGFDSLVEVSPAWGFESACWNKVFLKKKVA